MPQPTPKLTVAAVLKIRDLYAETLPQVSQWTQPQRRYSHADIAKIMGCSETTVQRVVRREGAYAFVGGDSLGEIQADPRKTAETAAAAAASLARLQKLMAENPVDDKPDPQAKLSPEMTAQVAAIRERLKEGNLPAKTLSNTVAGDSTPAVNGGSDDAGPKP